MVGVDSGGAVTWLSWEIDPSILLGLLVVIGAYGWSARRCEATGESPDPRQRVFFGLAVIVVLIALASPLHVLGESYLFTAHMVQHLLLTLIMPPLLLLSLSEAMLRPLLRLPAALPVGRWLTRPLIAYWLCNGIFLVSHLPWLYDLALRDHAVHITSHLLFMSTAIILWWPVLSPVAALPRLPFAAQLLYLFAQVLPGSLIGGLIANTERPLYAIYAAAPRVTPLSAVHDQQLGAIVMWVGGGTFFLLAFTYVFFRWAAQDMASQPAHRT